MTRAARREGRGLVRSFHPRKAGRRRLKPGFPQPLPGPPIPRGGGGPVRRPCLAWGVGGGREAVPAPGLGGPCPIPPPWGGRWRDPQHTCPSPGRVSWVAPVSPCPPPPPTAASSLPPEAAPPPLEGSVALPPGPGPSGLWWGHPWSLGACGGPSSARQASPAGSGLLGKVTGWDRPGGGLAAVSFWDGQSRAGLPGPWGWGDPVWLLKGRARQQDAQNLALGREVQDVASCS